MSSFFQKFADEPLKSGFTTLFTTISAIAFVNLSGEMLFEQSHMAGTPMLLLALITSSVIGGISVLRSNKLLQQKSLELQMAQALATGDLSKSITQTAGIKSPLQNAMSAIAEHQLNIERKYQRLIQEASMRQSHLSSALDCLPDELAVFNSSGLLLYANSAYLNRCADVGAVVALGMTRTEILTEIAKAPNVHLPLNERQTWVKNQDQMRREALASQKPIRYARTSGEYAQLSCQLTKDRHELEIVSNISAILSLEERVQTAELQSSSIARQQQSTLTRLSHTIRTPMNGVLAAAELMRETQLDDKQMLRLDIIRRSAGTLLGVVQDMFELASAPNRTEVLDNLPRPEKRQHALICANPTNLAQQAREQLERSDFDVTLIDLSQDTDVSSKALTVVEQMNASLIVVNDEAQRRMLSSAFDLSRIAKRPDLKIFSEILAQTEHQDVLITLNEKQHMMLEEPKATSTPIDALIVESGEVNQIYFGNYLSGSGYSFKILGSGAEALDAVKSALPRLILLDIAMSDTDSLSVTKCIRETIAKTLPNYSPIIIGLANNFVQGDMIKCIKAGMDHYASKPRAQEDIQALLDNWLAREPFKIAS